MTEINETNSTTERKSFIEWIKEKSPKIVKQSEVSKFLEEPMYNAPEGIPGNDFNDKMYDLEHKTKETLRNRRSELQLADVKFAFAVAYQNTFELKNGDGVENGVFDPRNVMKGGYVGSIENSPSQEVKRILLQEGYSKQTTEYLKEDDLKNYGAAIKAMFEKFTEKFNEVAVKNDFSIRK